MDTIYKFALKMLGLEDAKIPHFGRIISAINQEDRVVVYSEIDLGEITKNVRFAVLGTGHKTGHIDKSWTFLNTVPTNNAQLVWHIYYKVHD